MSQDVMTFACSACGAALTVPRAFASVTGPCPCCSAVITAPAADAVPFAVAPPEEVQSTPEPVLRLPPRSRVAAPPERGVLFSLAGKAVFAAIVIVPIAAFGIMIWDMKGMFDDKQSEQPHTAEGNLINFIDQIVHPADPKWQQQGGPDLTEGAILIEGERLRHQPEIPSRSLEIGRLITPPEESVQP